MPFHRPRLNRPRLGHVKEELSVVPYVRIDPRSETEAADPEIHEAVHLDVSKRIAPTERRYRARLTVDATALDRGPVVRGLLDVIVHAAGLGQGEWNDVEKAQWTDVGHNVIVELRSERPSLPTLLVTSVFEPLVERYVSDTLLGARLDGARSPLALAVDVVREQTPAGGTMLRAFLHAPRGAAGLPPLLELEPSAPHRPASGTRVRAGVAETEAVRPLVRRK